jgi:hypothetical protein
LLGTTLASAGCRVTEEDVHRWATRSQGPRKLVAVLTHAKYPTPLRVEAAMTLVRMKPREGRPVGLQGNEEFTGLLQALTEMPSEARTEILTGVVPQLEQGMLQERGAADGSDPSLPYKDAAYALLTHEAGLLGDPALRQRLLDSLVRWANTSFTERLDDSSQIYSMEQVLRLLKADGVRGLTGEIQPNAKKIDTVARLIRELGDDKTKLEASERLVQVAKDVDSEAWIKRKAPSVEAANKASKLTVTEAQFAKQLEMYQEEELLRVFSSMKSVGQAPAAAHLLAYAQEGRHAEKRRAAALAALEGNLDRNKPEHAQVLLGLLANDETPDAVRDVAARRIGELPREQVAERLYALFHNKRWQVRWVAASLLLRMSEARHVEEFMKQLGTTKDMALSEPLAYGPLLQDVKGAKPDELVALYARPNQPVQARLAALGYYYRNGSQADLPKVDAYARDDERVPRCLPDAKDCDWECSVTSGQTRELKKVATVGDFVEYCIKPALTARAADPGGSGGTK